MPPPSNIPDLEDIYIIQVDNQLLFYPTYISYVL